MLIVSPLFAQNSEVAGRVTDHSKAAVSGAGVTLVQTDTGGRRGTSPEGYYTFPLLLPGTYELTVIKGGFQKQSRTGITVETGQISTVDVELAVGLVTETVNVTESVPLLQSETAAVTGVVENKTIVDMPLLDRRSSQLHVQAHGRG